MKLSFKVIAPLLYTGVIVGLLIIIANLFANNIGISYPVVYGANILFLLMSLFIFNMQYQALYHKNPQVFIRSVMGGMLIKIFVCVIAVVAYYFLSGPAFNKPAVYAGMVIYIIYLVVEVSAIMKLNKGKHG